MSRAVKTVVAVAAAVAVPFAAPAIATAIGLSAAIGATAGAAVVGGTLGAAVGAGSAAMLGQNVGRGALIGGVGGAIGGGLSGANAAPVAGAQSAGAATAFPVDMGSTITAAPLAGGGLSTAGTGLSTTGAGLGVADAGLGSTLGTGLGAADGGLSSAFDTTFSAVGPEGVLPPTTTIGEETFLTAGAGGAEGFGGTGIDPTRAGVGLRMPDGGFTTVSERALTSGAPTDFSLASGVAPSEGLRMVAPNTVTGGTDIITGGGTYTSTAPITAYSGTQYSPMLAAGTAPSSVLATAPAGATGAAGSAPSTFTEALARVPAAIATRFTDPNVLADLVLRAGGQLAGSAIAGDGLTAEEQQLLDAQTEELRNLQATNQELFNQKLSAAQALIGESRYFDPEYFGLQRARRAQVAGARAKQAGLRGLTGERRQAEGRRYDLATGRDVGTAFDVGYGTGIQGRLQTQQAGLAAFPQPMGYGSVSAYNYPMNAYGAAQNRVSQTQQNIGQFIGDITGRQSALSRGGLY